MTKWEIFFNMHQEIVRLRAKVRTLESQANANTETVASGQEVVQGVTGTQYTPQVFEGPSGVPRKAYPYSEEQQ